MHYYISLLHCVFCVLKVQRKIYMQLSCSTNSVSLKVKAVDGTVMSFWKVGLRNNLVKLFLTLP